MHHWLELALIFHGKNKKITICNVELV